MTFCWEKPGMQDSASSKKPAPRKVGLKRIGYEAPLLPRVLFGFLHPFRLDGSSRGLDACPMKGNGLGTP